MKWEMLSRTINNKQWTIKINSGINSGRWQVVSGKWQVVSSKWQVVCEW